ncbi:hypothetical protein ABZ608_09095 [Streptomyces sp. NPDC013172]|uniref:hypothetical protein n=1 Tax=Streptomyces sp. NPDC013172 TaxID=3155009 RepID=UPI0033CE9769
MIDHPAGEQAEFDRLELSNPSAARGITGKPAHLLAAAMDALVRRLGMVSWLGQAVAADPSAGDARMRPACTAPATVMG